MSTINIFMARLFDTCGAYRKTLRNEPAIAFIQRGAGLGTKVWDKLPTALGAASNQAAHLLNSRGDDNGYRTLINVAEILLPAAVKQLYYTQKDETRKDEMRVRVQGYSFDASTGKEQVTQDISADAWAEGTTLQLESDNEDAHAGNDMGFEKRGMEDVPEDISQVRFTSTQLREFVDELAKLLFGFVLPADKLVNGWRADYADRPALAFLIAPRNDGSYARAETVDQALQMLALMEDQREVNNRVSNQRLVAASAGVWS